MKNLKQHTTSYQTIVQSILFCKEHKRNNKHEVSTIIRTFIFANVIKTAWYDTLLTP